MDHARVVHFAVDPNRGFDEDIAADPRRHGRQRIDGLDVLDLPGPIDSFTDTERARGRRRVRRLDRRSATSATGNAACHAVGRAADLDSGGCALARRRRRASWVQPRCLTASRAVRRPASPVARASGGAGRAESAGEGRSTDFARAAVRRRPAAATPSAGIRSDTSISLRGVRSARAALAANSSSTRITSTTCTIAEVLQAAGRFACFDSTKSRSVNHSRLPPRSTTPCGFGRRIPRRAFPRLDRRTPRHGGDAVRYNDGADGGPRLGDAAIR